MDGNGPSIFSSHKLVFAAAIAAYAYACVASAGLTKTGMIMRTFSIVMLILAGSAINMSVASAQTADACKECRDVRRACLTAHSQAACKTDYDICMKHCRMK